MIDIFNIPMYYISFNRKNKLEKNLKNVGFSNVNHFQAVDGRKMDIKDVFKKGIITPRSYNDLVSGREQHTGLPSLGAVGCSLSHISLWKMCVEKFPFIIIAEDDLIVSKITSKDVENISRILNKPNSLFISSDVTKLPLLYFTHFYILSKESAKNLLTNALPISISVDHYIGSMGHSKNVNVEGYKLFKQKKDKKSTTGDGWYCIKCILPKSPFFYIGIIVLIITLFIFSIFFVRKFKKTKVELDSCRSSNRSSLE